MTRYDLVVFDWDGTLIDSIPRIVTCFQTSFMEVGLDPPSSHAIRQHIGIPLKHGLKALAPHADSEGLAALAASYRHNWLDHGIPLSSLYKGVPAMLEQLIGLGYQLAIATGKSRQGLDREMNHHHITHHFRYTRCSEETSAKPHPEMLLELMAAHRVACHRTLMVGDTTMDLDMARNACVDGVAVISGSHSQTQLMTSRPVACLEVVTQLCAWLTDD